MIEPERGYKGGLRLRHLAYEPSPLNAVRFAEDIVEKATRIDGRDQDYSVESLRDVDDILGSWHDDGTDAADVGEAVFGFGCYVGEVLVRVVRAFDGSWAELDLSDAQLLGGRLVVRGRDGTFWNPIGKAFKRVTNGSADSVQALARLVASR